MEVSFNRISSLSLTNNGSIKTFEVSNIGLANLSIKNIPNIIAWNTKNNNNLSQICVANVEWANSKEYGPKIYLQIIVQIVIKLR